MIVDIDNHCTVSFVFSLKVVPKFAGVVCHHSVGPQTEGSFKMLLVIEDPEVDKDAPPVKMIKEDRRHQEPVNNPQDPDRHLGNTNIALV